MYTWLIGNYTLEYDDDTHTYLVDGVIVPSITQMLSVKFGNKYASVNRSTLERAAERGTAIHKAIEDYCKLDIEGDLKEVRNFRFLRRQYGFEVIENETPIILYRFCKPIAAGRLDLVIDDNLSGRALADIKTTAVLDKEYLAYQLNLYRIGYIQSYGYEIKGLYGIHLKDDKRKFVNIPINEALAWDIIDEYERVKQ